MVFGRAVTAVTATTSEPFWTGRQAIWNERDYPQSGCSKDLADLMRLQPVSQRELIAAYAIATWLVSWACRVMRFATE